MSFLSLFFFDFYSILPLFPFSSALEGQYSYVMLLEKLNVSTLFLLSVSCPEIFYLTSCKLIQRLLSMSLFKLMVHVISSLPQTRNIEVNLI